MARTEFDVLRHLEALGLPAVTAVGLAEAPDRESAILVTEYLDFSIQYRRLLMRFPLGRGRTASGCWMPWPGCSSTSIGRGCTGVTAPSPTPCSDATATRSRRSSSTPRRARSTTGCPRPTSVRPRHPGGERGLRPGRPGGMQGRDDASDDAVEAAETVRRATRRCGTSCTWSPSSAPGPACGPRPDPAPQRARVAVDEISLEPADGTEGSVRLKVAVANRRFHARELQRMTGISALEGQARLLLNDLNEYRAWLEFNQGRPISEAQGAERWLDDVLEPALAELVPSIGDGRDPLQAYCDVLEQNGSCPSSRARTSGCGRRSMPTSALARHRPIGHRAEGRSGRPRYRLVVRVGVRPPGGWLRRAGRRRGARPGRPVTATVRVRRWHHADHDADGERSGRPSAGPHQALRRRPGGRGYRLRGAPR